MYPNLIKENWRMWTLFLVQWSGRFLGVTGWDPSVWKSNRLHVHILRFPFPELGYILYIPLKQSVVFLQSWTSTGYVSNSTGSSVTNCRFSPVIGRLGHLQRPSRWLSSDVGGIWFSMFVFLFMFSYFNQLDVHIKMCCAWANLRWITRHNRIENQTSFGLVTIIGSACLLIFIYWKITEVLPFVFWTIEYGLVEEIWRCRPIAFKDDVFL